MRLCLRRYGHGSTLTQGKESRLSARFLLARCLTNLSQAEFTSPVGADFSRIILRGRPGEGQT